MCNGQESVKVDPSKIPDDERVDDVEDEAMELTQGDACYGSTRYDAGWGEEEEHQRENCVGDSKVD